MWNNIYIHRFFCHLSTIFWALLASFFEFVNDNYQIDTGYSYQSLLAKVSFSRAPQNPSSVATSYSLKLADRVSQLPYTSTSMIGRWL